MPNLVRWIGSFVTSERSFLIGAALSATVGGLFYAAAARTVEIDAEQRFSAVVRSAHYTILGRIKSYTDVLRGTASIFQTVPELTREQFHRYVEGLDLDKQFPGIEAISYAQKVTEAERAEFERNLRVELGKMRPPIPFTHIIPPGKRDEYLVLTYIAPLSVSKDRFGVDLYGRAVQIPMLNDSRDTGSVSSSGMPIKMTKSITGLGMRLPIYRPGTPISTVAERRAAFIGSVGIGFSVERLLAGVLTELPIHGMRLRLIGVGPEERKGEPPRRFMLYDSEGSGPKAEASQAEFQLTLPIDYSGRNWQAQFSVRKTAMNSGLDAYIPWLALLAGATSCGLLYTLFQTLTSSRQRAMALAEEMTRELRASETNLQQSNAKLRELAAHADHIKESERKRIAREIHDDLGQNLLALRIEADLLARRTGDRHPYLHERARRTLQQIDATMKSVRQIINDLRPNVLDLGLNAAFDWQIGQFERRTGIPCVLIDSDQEIHVDEHCATALFRILQESLTNISRHANATRVRVELHIDQDRISMAVNDNGKGLQPGGRHKPGSFGLVGIEERVKILGGDFSISSAPFSGTTIIVSVPLGDAAVELPSDKSTPGKVESTLAYQSY